MIITILIPNADDATHERAQDALRAAGIDTFELHLQTPEQHEAHPIDAPIVGGPTDSEIREYLTRDASAFAAFLRREIRRDPAWWRRELRKQERIGNVDRVLRP